MGTMGGNIIWHTPDTPRWYAAERRTALDLLREFTYCIGSQAEVHHRARELGNRHFG